MDLDGFKTHPSHETRQFLNESSVIVVRFSMASSQPKRIVLERNQSLLWGTIGQRTHARRLSVSVKDSRLSCWRAFLGYMRAAGIDQHSV